MNEAERERIRAWVARSRAEQGLPSTVQDPVVLAKVAALLLASFDREQEAPRPGA